MGWRISFNSSTRGDTPISSLWFDFMSFQISKGGDGSPMLIRVVLAIWMVELAHISVRFLFFLGVK